MFFTHKTVAGWQVDGGRQHTTAQRHSDHNELKEQRLPRTRQQRRASSTTPEVLICFTASPSHMGSISNSLGKYAGWGKIHGAHNAYCWFCWVSRRVYFKCSRSWNSHKRTIRGKSEQRSRTQAGEQRSDNICDSQWWKTISSEHFLFTISKRSGVFNTGKWLSNIKGHHKNDAGHMIPCCGHCVLYQQHSEETAAFPEVPDHIATMNIQPYAATFLSPNFRTHDSIISLKGYWKRWEINTSMVPIQSTTMDWCINQ